MPRPACKNHFQNCSLCASIAATMFSKVSPSNVGLRASQTQLADCNIHVTSRPTASQLVYHRLDVAQTMRYLQVHCTAIARKMVVRTIMVIEIMVPATPLMNAASFANCNTSTGDAFALTCRAGLVLLLQIKTLITPCR